MPKTQSLLTRRSFLASASAAAVAAPTLARATSASYMAGLIDPGNMSTVIQWSDAMLQAVRDRSIAPPAATRLFAMGHMAGLVAADAINGKYRLPFRLPEAPSQADPDIAYGAAVALATARTAGVNTRRQLQGFLESFPDGEGKGHGVAWGEYVGNMIVNWREDDGIRYARSHLYGKKAGPMAWEKTGPFFGAKNAPRYPQFAEPLMPGWGQLSPWGVAQIGRYRAEPFPEMHTREFSRQLEKVHEIGGWKSSSRTEDQTEIAFFWEDGPLGVSPPGHWQIIALKLIQKKRMDLSDQARAMALFSMAQADSGIAAWDSKYAYDVVRPETVMRAGAMDIPMA
ncbi:MAG: hypothetical protein AAF618_09590, partial [Pseudomonadota bacterium]